jgi:diguanylate cyclase (GGDEF)-like protein
MKNIRRVDIWMIRLVIYYFLAVAAFAILENHRFWLLPNILVNLAWYELSRYFYRNKKRWIRWGIVLGYGLITGMNIYFIGDILQTMPYLYVTITVFFTMMYGLASGVASLVFSIVLIYLSGNVWTHVIDWSPFDWLFYIGVQVSGVLIVYNLNKAVIQKKQLAVRDGLTGLYNHRFFQEYLGYRFSLPEQKHQPIAVIIGDIDHFKKYNDTFGHPAGDEVLKQIAYIITENVRSSDIVARYGGEEFIVILPNSTKEDALAVAERIREAVDAFPFEHGKLTISLGVSSYPEHADSKDALIVSADQALYKAKQYRNKVMACS